MPRRPGAARAALLAFLLAAFAAFAALGVWQVERLGWKRELIARVERNVRAAPVAPPAKAQWGTLTREADEYRRLAVQGRFDYAHEALVRASTALGAGYWVLTPMRTEEGAWVLVNRGFITPEMRERVPHEGDAASVTGLLRLSEPGGSFLQANDPAHGRWYSRDVAAIAAAQGLQGEVAPFFVDAQALTPADRSAWPRPGLTVLQFANNHLEYAVTWFALAAGVAAAAGLVIASDRRRNDSSNPPDRAA
jgi:surfeit locus 1 family protein